jgi:hypothetical protein
LGNKLVYKGKKNQECIKEKNRFFLRKVVCVFFPFLPLKKIYENRKSQPPQPQSKIQTTIQTQQEVCHIVALRFTFKSIKARRRIMENSNISPCKNIIFKKSSKRNQNPSRYYNSITTNLKFQHKPKYHLSKILT